MVDKTSRRRAGCTLRQQLYLRCERGPASMWPQGLLGNQRSGSRTIARYRHGAGRPSTILLRTNIASLGWPAWAMMRKALRVAPTDSAISNRPFTTGPDAVALPEVPRGVGRIGSNFG